MGGGKWFTTWAVRVRKNAGRAKQSEVCMHTNTCAENGRFVYSPEKIEVTYWFDDDLAHLPKLQFRRK